MSKMARLGALVCGALALDGCYATTEVGYVNTVRAVGHGGVSVVARAGASSEMPSDMSLGGMDLALRVDVTTSGSRVALGNGFLLAPRVRDRELTPFVRPSAWLALGHWGPANDDFWLTPSLDLGVMMGRADAATSVVTLYLLGTRLEYLGRAGEPDRSLGGTVYFGYGAYEGWKGSFCKGSGLHSTL